MRRSECSAQLPPPHRMRVDTAWPTVKLVQQLLRAAWRMKRVQTDLDMAVLFDCMQQQRKAPKLRDGITIEVATVGKTPTNGASVAPVDVIVWRDIDGDPQPRLLEIATGMITGGDGRSDGFYHRDFVRCDIATIGFTDTITHFETVDAAGEGYLIKLDEPALATCGSNVTLTGTVRWDGPPPIEPTDKTIKYFFARRPL